MCPFLHWKLSWAPIPLSCFKFFPLLSLEVRSARSRNLHTYMKMKKKKKNPYVDWRTNGPGNHLDRVIQEMIQSYEIRLFCVTSTEKFWRSRTKAKDKVTDWDLISQIRNALHDLPRPGLLPRFVVLNYGPYRHHFETWSEKPTKGKYAGTFFCSFVKDTPIIFVRLHQWSEDRGRNTL